MTRICVFGAGAIGGYVAARLALKGEADISVVARGPHLAAMQANGLKLRQGGEELTVRPALAADPRALGPQDYIILTLKSHAVPGIIAALEPLLGKDTAILFGQNGLPWWYFYRHGGPYDGHRLQSVDPGGEIWRRLGPERALGAVIWQAAEIEAPGVIAHHYGERMPIAEPSGEKTERVATLSKLLTAAGIKSPVRGNLRDEIWLKLWGNLSFNPVSVLTGGTLAELATDPRTKSVLHAMMSEAQAVAQAFGVKFAVGVDERIAMASRVGAHRTSMLQDAEARRPIELDALLGAVIELAQMASIGTPALQLVYDLTSFRTRQSRV